MRKLAMSDTHPVASYLIFSSLSEVGKAEAYQRISIPKLAMPRRD